MNRLALPLALLSTAALFAGCSEPAGPHIQGRWAATGIELTAQPLTIALQLPCATKGQVPRTFVTDSRGIVGFTTPVTAPQGVAYTVGFQGQLHGDTLSATVTSTFAVGKPLVQTFTMLPDGDPQFGSFYCID